MNKLKRILLALAIIVIAAICIGIFIYNFSKTGRTSGKINLLVNGEEAPVDGVAVEFSYENGDGTIKNYISQIKDNTFRFDESEYAVYLVKFSLEPSLWGDTGKAIQFETEYFCTYNKAVTNFNLLIKVSTEKDKFIEFVASEGSATISSDELPIDKYGMTINVYIPSP